MALLDVDFYSEALMRQVSFKAIIPIESGVHKPLRTLYLLHGIMGNHTDWLTGTRIAHVAARFGMAVVMPAGENGFYVDQEGTHNLYGEYVGRELVEATRRLFPLSDQRQDTFIAGLSMGGYGAIRNGLKYHRTFGALAGLSSALILDHAVVADNSEDWYFRRRVYYEAVFGDLTRLKGSDKDPEALVRMIKSEGHKMPRIWMACGTEDFLIHHNRGFRDFLAAENVDHAYVEGPGAHDWAFWDEYIVRVMEWLSE